jgi:hypothetical protein
MTALQLMTTRESTNQIDWSKIEHESFKLPPIFKIFHSVYDISTLSRPYSYYSNQYKMVDTFCIFEHKVLKGEVFDTIFHPNQLEEMLPKMLDFEDDIDQEILEQDVIPIIYCPGQELVMLGVGKSNADKIFYFARWKEERLALVAENIFEFFKDYYIEIEPVYLHGITLNQLYRNWNEDFWRVREEA